jgi:spermidine synthase
MTETTRYFDRFDDSSGLYFEATELLHHSKSEWQDIKIIDTELHGRVMLLDDVTMLTQSTHHVYHEHMIHIPLACIETPRSVLVIGGGDGGSVSELVKYPEIEHIVLAELDGDVVSVSKQFLPDVAAGLSDPRVEIRIGDGAALLQGSPGVWDAVIIDSTDICEDAHEGDDIASPLATDAFYDSLKVGLKPGGVAMQMLGSPTFYRAGMKTLMHRLAPMWESFKPVLMPCPFYISGDWCAGMLSDTADLTPRFHHGLTAPLKYYNGDVAMAALALPNEVRNLMPD